MKQFDQETRLEPQSSQQFGGQLHAHWNIGNNPNGGYLIALGAAAMKQMHPEHPDPLSITAHYLRPGLGDQPCVVKTELVRTGKTISTSRATLLQEDKARIEILASFGALGAPSQAPRADTSDDSGVLNISAPAIPLPDDCIGRTGEAQGVTLPILDRLDIRLHPDEARPGATGMARVSGWLRFKDGREPDTLAALLFADAFPPAVFGLLGLVGWVPTIEMTVHVRRRPAPGWVQVQFQTLEMADGKMIESGLLWDSQGHLIAQSRQLAMLLKRS